MLLKGNKSSQDRLVLRSHGFERIDMVTGTGRSPVKEEGNGRGSVKNHVSAPMTDREIAIGRIDTTEIVKELETEIGTERETAVVVIVTEHVNEAGIVVVIMSAIEKETVTGTGTGTGIMMLVTMNVTVGVLGIGIGNLIMTVSSPNMREIGTVRGIMIMVSQMRIMGGLSSMIMGIGGRT